MIFVDTSFWVALRNRRDPNHDAATALLATHGNVPLVTSNHVQGETWTFLRRTAGHASAVGFLDALQNSARVEVVRASEDIDTAAWRWLRHRDDREYSFVDATSFAVMKALRISSALAFDGDFTAAGFVELRP